jgi:hypothetical protein
MNKGSIDRIFRDAGVPDCPDDYWDRFPDRVIESLKTTRQAPVRARPLPWQLGGALIAATACGLVLGFVFWHRHLPREDNYGALRDGRVLRELQTQYPGRLQAIIQDGSGLHTQLSDAADVSTSNPIYLEIRDGTDHRVVVTFSGQLVRCGGKNVMVLSDAGGEVILVGEGFFWSRQTSAGLSKALQIQAEPMPADRGRSRPSPSL